MPTFFYGLLGTGSTLIVWALVEFDPLRPDFYACLFAAAAPLSFLLHTGRTRKRDRPASRRVSVLMNLACIAAAANVALGRPDSLSDPVLGSVLLLLTVTPLLSLAAMLDG